MLDVEEAERLIEAEGRTAEESLRKECSAELDFVTSIIGVVRVQLEAHRSQMRADSAARAVLPFLLSRLVRIARAVQRLCAGGYGVEAEILVRAGLEALVNLLFLSESESEERARLYIEFDRVISKGYFDRIDRWPDMRDDAELNRRREGVLAAYEQVKRNYPDPNFWAGKLLPRGRLRAMTNEVGLAWYYDFIYWYGSNHAHSNARSANEYVDVKPNKDITYKFGPSARYVTVPLNLMSDFLIRGLDRTLAFHGIDAAEILRELRRAHEAVFGKSPIPGGR